MLFHCFGTYSSCIRDALSIHAFLSLVLVQPKVVRTHSDLWNQTPNQDMEWTPESPFNQK